MYEFPYEKILVAIIFFGANNTFASSAQKKWQLYKYHLYTFVSNVTSWYSGHVIRSHK